MTPSAADALWSRHHAEWRDPAQVASQWQDAGAIDPETLAHRVSGDFWDLLADVMFVVTCGLVACYTRASGLRRVVVCPPLAFFAGSVVAQLLTAPDAFSARSPQAASARSMARMVTPHSRSVRFTSSVVSTQRVAVTK